MTKIAHISDVHFRSLKRHEEYRIVFENPEGTKMTVAFTELHDNHKEVESNIGG